MREYVAVYIPLVAAGGYLSGKELPLSGDSTKHVDCEECSRRDYPRQKAELHENGFAQPWR